MNEARRSLSTTGRRTFAIPGLLLVLPLVIGARECERTPADGDACEGADCSSSGEAGQGAAARTGGGAAGSAAAGQGGGQGGSSGGGRGCFYAGERHDVGDSFPSDDGCNSCTCSEGGQVACTLRACSGDDGGESGGGGSGEPGEGGGGQSGEDGGGDSGEGGSSGEAGKGGISGGGSGQTCGGIASLECSDPDEFCNYDTDAGGQGCDGTISDAGGVCQTRPGFCTQQYDPVCGCDRRTYSTDCEAHAAGMSILHDGACTEIDCAEIGGHAVNGIGPGPMCPQGEVEHGSIVYSNGMIAIEGSICCVPQ